ncbi:amidohydrolase [Streptomyces sp. BG9H]|uniref:Amidohydrolase n=1 Tax=Streptomyces anatolicus TaxID=2675858 RepID=A0ABS6YHV4_9ACTN|nr:M20 family metallopeptidase [Streptomyces anatolicus]MBW5420980.1 amidohydrolase [Streptomyces anatolicus]
MNTSPPQAPDNEPGSVLADAQRLLPDVIAVRRAIHRAPELGRHLPRTQQTVLNALDGLDLTVSRGKRLSSVVATLDSGRPGRTILLRADMDALPQQDDSGVDFASEIPGVMHACGHDTHTAMLIGAARLLADRRAGLAGRVVFMFQPAEEAGGGAQHMIDEGVLTLPDGATVDAAFALHITTRHDTGTVHLRPGPLFAAADLMHLTVRGRSGHASTPHRALDPIPVACEIVQALQTMVTRTVSVFDPAVVTVARITAGTTTNIIPDTAEISGTFRTLSPHTRTAVREGIERVARGVASAHGATVETNLIESYPPVVNDADFAAFVTDVAGALIGPARVHHMPEPVMGAEDFSYVLQHVPGAMAFLGARPAGRDPEQTPDNHSSRVVYDEEAMAIGTALYATVAQEFLGS